MESNVLVPALIVKNSLEVSRENVPWEIGQVIQFEGEIFYPEVKEAFIVTESRL
jgi:hypothetical protein